MPILTYGHTEGDTVLPGKGRKSLMDKVTFDLHLEECRVSQVEKKGRAFRIEETLHWSSRRRNHIAHLEIGKMFPLLIYMRERKMMFLIQR